MNFTKRKETLFLAVHCSATQPKQDIGAAEIERWHRKRSFLAIGYHYVIRRDGTLELGRPDDTVGAHVEGHNSVSVGICLVGGVDAKLKPQDNFTPEQYDTLHKLLGQLKTKYPKAAIQGHRDFPNVAKACPSFDVKGWLKNHPL